MDTIGGLILMGILTFIGLIIISIDLSEYKYERERK
jgi:hypothetical protein